MFRRAVLAVVACVGLAVVPGAGAGADTTSFQPGAPGAGDPYFPTDGNGGYDVQHYLLDVDYTPQTDILVGVATITARATQDLSSFNLDLNGLTVRSVTVDGRSARWSRSGTELTVTPRAGLRNRSHFTTVVRYDGVPVTLGSPTNGGGVIHTDDGAVIIGQPHVAATWYPVNDHPSDKASYTFRFTVPAGLEAVGNGVLASRRTHGGRTTWTWEQKAPMASYLAAAGIGEFDLRAYTKNGIKFWDAVDPDLFEPITAHTGTRFAISQKANSSYKRLARTISVPAAGADLSFWVQRDTEETWDFVFVEAHPVGTDDWTTLPDRNGHTTGDGGNSCPFWFSLHPFLTHYQTENDEGTCTATGTTGTWSAASGASDGYEQWAVDLSRYAGQDIEVSISYASDNGVQRRGVFIDDVVVSTGAGTTSFEEDGDVLDGWTVTGEPAGTRPNSNDWITGTTAQAPSDGDLVNGSFAREPEILDFLSSKFGRYPFETAGGIVDSTTLFLYAIEDQTRPIYTRSLFSSPVNGDSVVVHELAHQWFGDNLSIAGWQDIWLNEGFATYAEWLWSDREGLGTAQENFDFFYSFYPADDPFWTLPVTDPGADNIFDPAVYYRGAMALHQLRLAVGDNTFFRILRTWATTHAGGNVTTSEFTALAERISGRDLDQLFTTWLFTPQRPAPAATGKQAPAADLAHVPAIAAAQLERLGKAAPR